MVSKNEYSVLDIFNDIFGDIDRIWSMPTTPIYQGSFPPCDVLINQETKDLKFHFALAGIDEEAIDLSFEGDYLELKISPIKPLDNKVDGFSFLQKGIKTSHVTKQYYVPIAKYQVDKIKVTFDKGILEVLIPARDEIKPRKLKING